ncbi:Heavy metal transport/detoxification superfamily protein [Euphorbia peplus]|nr:Heavy metal transport/detoxification superfamily protein [Euphorbia peplus]
MWRNTDKQQQQLLRVQTHVLKVHVNCEGCKAKVSKLLKKIDGVYSVEIDAENQLVIVSGCVDSSTLIKKLAKSGKRAELYSPLSKYLLKLKQPNLNQTQFLPNDFNLSNHNMFPNRIQGMDTFQNFPTQNIRNPPNQVRNFYTDEDPIFSTDSEDEMSYLMDPANYQENNTGFLGFGRPELDGMPSYRHGYLPPMAQRNPIYRQDENVNSNNVGGMYRYMPQPQVMNHTFSMPPSFGIGHEFPAAPPSYYW